MTTHKNYLWAYIGLAILIGGALLYFLFFSSGSGYVKVKYRDDKVNISSSSFEPLNKSDSTINGAWYDRGNEYMVIKLNGVYYHYCGMPSDAWGSFKSAFSSYGYYHDSIKGNFDCRVNPVPSYQQ